jgi:hypothetical protein
MVKRIILILAFLLSMISPSFAATQQVDALLSGLIDTSGNPLSAGLLYTYAAGTTTAKACYLDKDKTSPATNPIVLTSDGLGSSSTPIFCEGVYKFVVKDSGGSTLRTWDNLRYGSTVGGVSLGEYTSFTAAITAIGSTQTTLVIPSGTWNISDNPIVPSNVTLVWYECGGILTQKTGSTTLTIKGTIIAPPMCQIFSDSTGTYNWVRFGDNTTGAPNQPEIYAGWWGAKFDGATDDYAAWQEALNSTPKPGILIKHPGGRSNVGTTLVWPTDASYTYKAIIQGVPTASSYGSYTGSETMPSRIHFTGSGKFIQGRGSAGTDNSVFQGGLENLRLSASLTTTPKSGTYGLYVYDAKLSRLKNLTFYGFDYGIYVEDAAYYNDQGNVTLAYNNTGYYQMSSHLHGTTLSAWRFASNTDYGLRVAYSGHFTMSGCWFELNGIGASLSSVSSFLGVGNYYDTNTTADLDISAAAFYDTVVTLIGENHEPSRTSYSAILTRVPTLNITGGRFMAYNNSTSRAISFVGVVPRGEIKGAVQPRPITPDTTEPYLIDTPYEHQIIYTGDSKRPHIGMGTGLSSWTYHMNKGDIIFNQDVAATGGTFGWALTEGGYGGEGTIQLSGTTGSITRNTSTLSVNTGVGLFPGATIQVVSDAGGYVSFADGTDYAAAVKFASDGKTVTLDKASTNNAQGEATTKAVTYNEATKVPVYGVNWTRNLGKHGGVAEVTVTGGVAPVTGDLRTYSIRANALGTTGGIRVLAAGMKEHGAGNKTILFYFGTCSITFHAAANNENDWRFEADVYNMGEAAVQGITWKGYDGSTLLQGYDECTVDTTSAVTVKLEAVVAGNGDHVHQNIWRIDPK